MMTVMTVMTTRRSSVITEVNRGRTILVRADTRPFFLRRSGNHGKHCHRCCATDKYSGVELPLMAVVL
jgi:hypothetical protein